MTTTAMQFGQSTINVVLGEGTVPAKFGTDATGNVTGLVGPDGLPISLGSPCVGVVLIGDSITNNCGGTGTDNANKLANYGYYTWLNGMRRGAMRLIRNLGVAGQTMATLDGRIDGEVIPLYPGVVIWLLSGNGIVNGATATEEIVTISSIVGKLRGAGIHVLIGLIPPRATSGTGSFSTATMLQYVQQVNAYARYLAAVDSGIRVVDTHSAWLDFSTGVPKTGVCRGTPAIHPSVLGAYLLAETFNDGLNGWVSGSYQLSALGSSYNLISTALGSWTHNVPTGTVTSTQTAASTGSDGAADWLEWEITAMSAGGAIDQMYHGNISTGYSVGDTIQAAIEFEIESATDMRAINYQIAFNGASANLDTCSEYSSSSSGLVLPSVRQLKRGILITTEYAVPASTTSLTPKLRMMADSASSVMKARFRNPVIRNITTCGY